MNKEERINLLENLRSNIISDFDLQERIEFLEEAAESKKEVEDRLANINEKLADEKNYYRSAFIDEAIEDNYTDLLETATKEQKDAQDLLEKYNAVYANINEQIESQSKYLDEVTSEIAVQNEELRDSEDMSEREFNNLRKENSKNQEIKKNYEESIESNKKDKEDIQTKIDEITSKLEGLNKNVVKAQEDLDKFRKGVEADKGVDLIAMNRDKDMAKKMEATIKKIDESVEIASYDHEKELTDLIEDYKNDKVTTKQVNDKIKEIRNHMTTSYLNENIVNVSDKNKENLEIHKELSNEITSLKEKLSNDDNYMLSVFEVERNNRDVAKKIVKKLDNYAARIDFNSKVIEEYSKYVENDDEVINDLKSEKEAIQRSIRKAGNTVDANFEKESLARIEEIDNEMFDLAPTIAEDKKKLEEAKKEKKLLETKNNRYTKIYEKRKETLEKRNSIDANKKRLDMIELARLQSSLVALENSQKHNSDSVYEIMEDLLNGKAPKIDKTHVVDNVVVDTPVVDNTVIASNTNETPEKATVEVAKNINPTTVIKADEPVQDETNRVQIEPNTNKFIVVSADKPELKVEKTEEEKAKDATIVNAFVSNLGNVEKTDSAEIEKPEEEIEESKEEENSLIAPIPIADDPLGLGDAFSGKKKCTFTDRFNEKCKEIAAKAKEFDLKKKLKQWAGRIAIAIATIAATAAVLSKCAAPEDIPVVTTDDTTISGNEMEEEEDNHDKVSYDYDLDERERAIEEGKERQANDQGATAQAASSIQTSNQNIAPSIIGDAAYTTTATVAPVVPLGMPLPSEISVDIPVTTVEDPVVWNFDTTNPDSYGDFIETDVVPGTIEGVDGFTPDEFISTDTDPVVNPDTPIVTPDEPVVTPDTPTPDQPVVESAPANVVVETGESLVLPGDDGTNYVLNNGNPMEVQGANMIENPELQSLTEDEAGNMNVEVSAESIERDHELTNEEVQAMQAQFNEQNNPVVTESAPATEQQAVEQSYEEPVEEQGFSR